MNTPPITPSSSAEGLPPPTFIERKSSWVDMMLSDELTPAAKVAAVAISQKFNTQYYERTGGELFAWPGWEFLNAATCIVETTINRGIKQLEARGWLFVEHGRRRGRRRDGNKYFARMPQGPHSGPWPWPQGANLTGRDLALEEKLMNPQPVNLEPSQMLVKEKRVRKRDESLRVEYKEGSQGPIFEPREVSDSDSDSKKESRTPEQAALRPEAGKAVNGSPDSVALDSVNEIQNEAAGEAAAAPRRPHPWDIAQAAAREAAAREAAARAGAAARPEKVYPRVEASPELRNLLATNGSGQ